MQIILVHMVHNNNNSVANSCFVQNLFFFKFEARMQEAHVLR